MTGRKGLMPDGPLVHEDCRLENASLGPWTEIGRGSVLLDVEMGAYSYCARFCDIANATIGRFSNIASFVRIGPTDHPLDRASLHHFMYRSSEYWPDREDDADFFARRRARRATIGHDTWLGHNALVRPEVTVGHGAVLAAGAIVTKDVAPYTIVAGVPARPLRRRLAEPLAERLVALAWWDWPHDRIEAALDDFRHLTVEAFLEKHGG